MNKVQMKTIKYISGLIIFSSALIFNISFAQAAPTYSADTLISLTNSARSQNGLGALLGNQNLSSAAFAKAQDILAKGYFAHNSPDGKTPWDFINESGYVYTYAGENLAIGYTDASELFTAWMNSPTHRENILNTNYREIGVAVVEGNFQGTQTIVAVQEFGARSGNTASPEVAAQTATPTPASSGSVQPTSTPVVEKFAFIKDKSNLNPKSIFSGEEVEFTVTVSGEIKSLEAQVFNKKYNILETGSVNTGSTKEKTYTLKQKIKDIGSSEVRIVGVGVSGNQDALSLGTIDVKETVIAKPAAAKTSFIGSLTESFKTNWIVYVVGIGLVALLVAGYFIHRKNKNNSLAAFWRLP